MAQSNENWLGSWFSAAKEKLKNSEVLESVCKDLGEFGGAVTKGASTVITSTGNVLEKTLSLDSPDSTASTVKRSFSTFLDQVNTALNPSPDDSDTEAIMIIDGSEAVKLTKLQQNVYDLQKNEMTFTMEPDAHLNKQYECWLEIIEDEIPEEKIEKYLKSSDILRKQYEKLVPHQIDKENFWRRYLFKKALIEDEIARQEIQEKRELKANQLTEESVEWDNEEFANDIDLSEEQQIKLLEEYEREKKLKMSSNSKKNSSPSKSTAKNPDKLTKEDLSKINSAVSLETASSSSSSLDDDWEKVTEVDK